MGQRWRSDGKIVPIRPGPWTSVERYGVPAGRGGPSWAITVLLGAVFVGAIGGLAWVRWPAQTAHEDASAIEWNAVQAVPTRTPDAEDLLWQARARGNWAPDQVRGAAVRASFGYCYRGGGTDCVVDGDTFYIGGEKVRGSRGSTRRRRIRRAAPMKRSSAMKRPRSSTPCSTAAR